MNNIDWEDIFISIMTILLVCVVIIVLVIFLIGTFQRFDDTVMIINKWSEQSTHYIKSGDVNVPYTTTDFYFSTERGKFSYNPGASYVKYIEIGAKVCITFNGLNTIIDLKVCN